MTSAKQSEERVAPSKCDEASVANGMDLCGTVNRAMSHQLLKKCEDDERKKMMREQKEWIPKNKNETGCRRKYEPRTCK